MIGSPDGRLDGVSPCFVLAERGTELFTELVERGVAVRMLTHSQVATDVIAVHAGYTRRRDDLLQSGVELFEIEREVVHRTEPDTTWFGRAAVTAIGWLPIEWLL